MFKQKCLKLLLLVAATASSLTSWAAGFGYDFEDDGFRYTITSETTVEVSFNNYGSYSGSVVIPQSASDGNKKYSVTGIGSNAFSNQDQIIGVTFPDGVTVIKDGAFSGCTGLEYVVFPPTSLTTIESSAFSGCTALDDVEIPKSVTTIPYECFSGCSDLQTLKLPEGLAEIGISAFESCSNLKSITLPSTLTNIKDGAFWQCDAMASIVVKATKPPVCGTNAFLSNKKNTTVTVDQIANIPAYMQAAEWKDFSHYTGVTLIDGITYYVNKEDNSKADILNVDSSVSEPNIRTKVTIDGKEYPMTYIGSEAFHGNRNITKIVVPEGVTEICDFAFAECTWLTSVTLPSSVTVIGKRAFSSCYSLVDVNLSSGITQIDTETFASCSKLKSIVIPEGVTLVGESAFNNCPQLESVVLPSTLEQIYISGFGSCDALTSITVNSPTPPKCNFLCFSNYDATVTTPSASASSYVKNGTWSYFNYAGSGAVTLDGITYVVADDGASADVGYVRAYNSDVVELPSKVTIDGKEYPLTQINSTAFQRGMASFPDFTTTVLKAIVIPEGVATISDEAFKSCPYLTSVTLPSTLTTIGDSAFDGCANLTAITVNAATPPVCAAATFNFDKSATTVTAPFESIPAYIAADGWTDFDLYSGVAIADGIVYRPVKGEADIYCVKPSVTEANIQPAVTIGDKEYALTQINETSFKGNNKITKAVVPEGVTFIDSWAFSECSNLASVTLPNSLTDMGYNVFTNSTSLDNVVIPSNMKTLPYHAFFGCTGLKSVVLPEGLTKIDIDAFYSCSSLSSITLPSTLTEISSSAFSHSGLKDVVIPESVKTIGHGAFYECENLVSITLPKDLTTIEDQTFRGCTSLAAINLPSSVQSIGKFAFYLCGSLKAITCEALVPPTVADEDAFEFDVYARDKGRSKCVLTMPAATREAYANDGVWSLFMDGTDNVVVGIEGEGRVAYADNKGIVFNGANICAKTNSTLTFAIKPAAGYDLQSATYASDDVTERAATGEFVTPAISADADFRILFAAKDYLAVNDLAVEAGDNVVLPIELVNPDEVSAVQVQIVLPEGVTVALDDGGKPMVEHDASRLVDQTLDATVDGQTLTITTQAGGHSYLGTTGTLLNVTLAVDANLHHGSYAISLSGAKLSMATGETANSPAAQCILAVSNPSGITDANAQTVKAYGEKGLLTILGAEGTTADIIATDGRVAASVKCASNSERIAMGKGVYLVRIDGNVTKVVVY